MQLKSQTVHVRVPGEVLHTIKHITGKRGKSTLARILVSKALENAYEVGLQYKVIQKLHEQEIMATPDVIEKLINTVKASTSFDDLVKIGLFHAGRENVIQ